MSNTITYKVLGGYGVYSNMDVSSLKNSLNASLDISDGFEKDDLSKMNSSSVSKAGAMGMVSALFKYADASATLGKMERMIKVKLPKEKGKYLFVGSVTRSSLDDSWMMSYSADIVKTNAPESMGRTLSKCNTGKIKCLSETPKRKGLFNAHVYIIAERN